MKRIINPIKIFLCSSVLRLDAIDHTRKRNGLSNVLDAAHPRRATLDSHSKTTVRNAAVTSQVEIPLKRFLRKLVQRDLLFEKLERRRTLTTTNHFAITLGREDINTQRQLRSLGIARHVKRFHRCRIMMDHHRSIKLARDIRLVGRTKVSTPFELRLERAFLKSLVQNLHRIVVMQTRKRRH